jgi:ankyrin repeat protein
MAAERGYEEIVSIIREEEDRRPADAPEPPGIVPEHGPLTLAVIEDRFDDLVRLLDAGADSNETTAVTTVEPAIYQQGAPLWQCVRLGRHAMAELLLARGADPNAAVYAAGTPMGTAYGLRDHRMIDLMTRHGGVVNAEFAGLYRDVDRARRLLVDETSAADLLWGAACGGSSEIVAMALDRIDWPRDDPRWYRMAEQPFRFWGHMDGHWARADFDRANYLACFRLVLARIDVHLPGRFGRTLLHDTAAFAYRMTPEESAAFATTLLDAGACLDARDDLLRSTPLGWACRWGRPELVRLLLPRGADPVEPDAEPWATPRAWAEKSGHSEIRGLL